MSFNKGYELKKFEAHWEKLRIEYAAAGMTKEGIADVLLRLGNERCKGFIFRCGRRNIIGGGWFGVLVYIAGAGEQIFPVSQRCHIDRIPGKRFFVHDVDRHMGKIEVFQLHLADIVVVRYFHVIVI